MKANTSERLKVVNHWTQTHFYDKNISKEALGKIQPFLRISNNVKKEEKLSYFDILRKELELVGTDKIGMRHYDQMINSYKKNDGKNYDPINKLDPIDLLYIIFLIQKDNKEILIILEEQLIDLRIGFCPQGRSVRLIQIIQAFL